jgi:hypothetical protein
MFLTFFNLTRCTLERRRHHGSNSASTRISSAPEVCFNPTIDFLGYVKIRAATSAAAIQRGCLPILVFAQRGAFAFVSGGRKIVDFRYLDHDFGSRLVYGLRQIPPKAL